MVYLESASINKVCDYQNYPVLSLPSGWGVRLHHELFNSFLQREKDSKRERERQRASVKISISDVGFQSLLILVLCTVP